jgi:hypothetical protein
VHAAFGNHFTVEVGKLLEEPDILQQGGATRAGGLDVLVVDNGRAKAVVSLFIVIP